MNEKLIETNYDITKKSAIRKFYEILDKWYNTELFEQDADKIWHEKFKIGIGL